MTKGFNAVILTLIIGAIAVVGSIILWRVREDKPTDTATQATDLLATSQSSVAEQSVQEDPNKDFVVIKEWGVRFKPSGLSGIRYKIGAQSSLADENVTFTTDTLAKYGAACSGTQDGDAPLGILTRTKQQKDEFHSESGAFVKRVGDYYYQYITPEAACSDEAEARAYQIKATSAFKDSIFTIELAKQLFLYKPTRLMRPQV